MAAGTGIGRLGLLTTLIVLGAVGCVAEGSKVESGGPGSSSHRAHRKAHRAEHQRGLWHRCGGIDVPQDAPP